MPLSVTALILVSAFAHASWNALVRAGNDRLMAVSMMSILGGAVAAIFCVLLPAPASASWPFIGASAMLQVAYCVSLGRAYELGELSLVYPLSRGAAPLCAAAGALVAAHESPTALVAAGLALVSGGITGLAADRRSVSGAAVAASLLIGAIVAGYTVVDGLGIRSAAAAPSYVAWLVLVQAIPLPFIYRLLRGEWPPVGLNVETMKGLAAGALALLSYGIVVVSMSTQQIARVAALRESSILFAALIGAMFLSESLTARRALCSLAVTAGVILIAA